MKHQMQAACPEDTGTHLARTCHTDLSASKKESQIVDHVTPYPAPWIWSEKDTVEHSESPN